MKLRLTFLSIISLILISGCEEETVLPEILTFTVNGEAKDFSDGMSIGFNTFDDFLIQGGSNSQGQITIFLEDDDIGVYTETDYRLNGNFSRTYDVSYEDENGDVFRYDEDNENASFEINVTTFDNQEGGGVAGEFSATLYGSIFNPDDAPDSVVITGGVFSRSLGETLEFN